MKKKWSVPFIASPTGVAFLSPQSSHAESSLKRERRAWNDHNKQDRKTFTTSRLLESTSSFFKNAILLVVEESKKKNSTKPQ